MKNEGNSIEKDFGFVLHISWLMFLFEMFNKDNEPRWKMYNARPPSKQELKKQKDIDDFISNYIEYVLEQPELKEAYDKAAKSSRLKETVEDE